MITANQPFDDPTSTRPIQDAETGPVDVGTPAFADVVRRRTEESVQTFLDDGRKVVMIEPIPVSANSDDPLKCLSNATYFEECRFVANMQPTAVEQIYRDLATRTRTTSFPSTSITTSARTCPSATRS